MKAYDNHIPANSTVLTLLKRMQDTIQFNNDWGYSHHPYGRSKRE